MSISIKHIERLVIKGLKTGPAVMELFPLTVITGPNATGKTRELNALEFVATNKIAAVGGSASAVFESMAPDNAKQVEVNAVFKTDGEPFHLTRRLTKVPKADGSFTVSSVTDFDAVQYGMTQTQKERELDLVLRPSLFGVVTDWWAKMKVADRRQAIMDLVVPKSQTGLKLETIAKAAGDEELYMTCLLELFEFVDLTRDPLVILRDFHERVKEKLSEIRVTIKSAEATATKEQTEASASPSSAPDINALSEKVKTLNDELMGLNRRKGESDERAGRIQDIAAEVTKLVGDRAELEDVSPKTIPELTAMKAKAAKEELKAWEKRKALETLYNQLTADLNAVEKEIAALEKECEAKPSKPKLSTEKAQKMLDDSSATLFGLEAERERIMAIGLHNTNGLTLKLDELKRFVDTLEKPITCPVDPDQTTICPKDWSDKVGSFKKAIEEKSAELTRDLDEDATNQGDIKRLTEKMKLTKATIEECRTAIFQSQMFDAAAIKVSRLADQKKYQKVLAAKVENAKKEFEAADTVHEATENSVINFDEAIQTKNAYIKATEAINKKQAELDELSGQQVAADIEEELSKLAADILEAEKQLTNSRTLSIRNTENSRRYKEAKETLDTANADLELFKRLSEVTGPNGMQEQYLRSGSAGFVEQVQNIIASVRPETEFFLRLDDMRGKPACDVGIRDKDGARKFESCSTSEQILIQVAMAVAFMQLDKRSNFRILLVDQLESLDVSRNRRQMLLNTLEAIHGNGWVDQVICTGVDLVQTDKTAFEWVCL